MERDKTPLQPKGEAAGYRRADGLRLIADMHTHTVFSRGRFYVHGKGTIMENAGAAAAAGLRELAISDHGPGHELYGLDESKLPEMRALVNEAAERYPGVKIHLGVEANIVDVPKGLDVAPEHFGEYDIVLAGYHYGTRRGYMVQNRLSSLPGIPSGSLTSLRNRNTDMALRALYCNNIYALTHPGDKGPFDMRELCRACEETDTLMEISARHTHLTAEEIELAAEYDVSFIINSDAHKPSQVGTYRNALERALLAGLDVSRIVNIEQIKA